VCWNHWKIPSAQKCYLCSRYILLPMSPGWTKENWSGREDLNLRPLVPNYETTNSKCFIWCRLGNSVPLFLSLSCTDLVPKGGNPQLLVNTLAVVIEKLESSMATRAEPPDCRDSNPESRRTPRRARFLIAVKVDEANAAPPLSF